MKRLMMLVVALSAVAAFAVEDSETFKVIDNSTEPGYVLQNNHHYTVVGHVVINAKSNPGQSALRLAPGTGAVSNAKPGLRYTLEACVSLAGGWQTVESRTAASGADIVFAVDGSAGRFFRVVVTDP